MAATHRFFKLDGHFYHSDAVRYMPPERFKGGDESARLANRRAATEAIGSLLRQVGQALRNRSTAPPRASSAGNRPTKARASEFYAVLIGDGDHIGRNLRSAAGEIEAKAGLANFTRAAPEIVRQHHGAPIYAGGDDILALLPLDTAICAARILRAAYQTAFAISTTPAIWTFSAAIVFAQYKIPLRFVLAEARRQLDDVAKMKNSRDSLALAVLKPGGVAFDWVSAWDDGAGCVPPKIMDALARELQAEREFTTGFLYNIRDRYEALFQGDKVPDIERKHMEKFLLAEHLRAGGQRNDKDGARARADAEHRIADLMQIGYPLERDKTTGTTRPAARFSFDAGPLMRFLAEEGRWFMAPASTSAPAVSGAEEQEL